MDCSKKDCIYYYKEGYIHNICINCGSDFLDYREVRKATPLGVGMDSTVFKKYIENKKTILKIEYIIRK